MSIYGHDVENVLSSISQGDTAQERSLPPGVGSNDSGKWSLLSMHDESMDGATHSQPLNHAAHSQPLGQDADTQRPMSNPRDAFQREGEPLLATPTLPVESNRAWLGENQPHTVDQNHLIDQSHQSYAANQNHALDQKRTFNPEPSVDQKPTGLRDMFQRIARPSHQHDSHESGSKRASGSGSLFSRFKR